MRRLVIGDIHGQFERMLEVLKLSSFDPEKDMLFPLGTSVIEDQNLLKS